MSLYSSLQSLFEKISLEFCDSSGYKIIQSEEYKTLSNLVHNWKELIQDGIKINKEETYRTLKHVFRVLKIYYSFIEGSLKLELENHRLSSMRKDLREIYEFSRDMMVFIFLYHDIGRPFNREWHTYESEKIMNQRNLLQDTHFSSMEKKMIQGLIKYHLTIGTIFTGESSYTGCLSMYADETLREIWKSPLNINRFFKISELFTIIDILGYDYSQIFDHYFDYYREIQENLAHLFSNGIGIESNNKLSYIYQELRAFDQDNIKWRIACAVRIFQFVRTEAYLTEEFYYNKLEQALSTLELNWDGFIEEIESTHHLIQFKYALPLMLVLSSKEFKREPLHPEDLINAEIFTFWIECSKKIRSFNREIDTQEPKVPRLWNFVFKLPRGWFIDKTYRDYVQHKNFFREFRKIKAEYDPILKSNLVNFRPSL